MRFLSFDSRIELAISLILLKRSINPLESSSSIVLIIVSSSNLLSFVVVKGVSSRLY